ncbi:hypothetical protein ABPG75_006478 [Micractinium tetrahymenae]
MAATVHVCSQSQLPQCTPAVRAAQPAAATSSTLPSCTVTARPSGLHRRSVLAPAQPRRRAASLTAPVVAAAAASSAGASSAADLEVDVCILGAGIIGLCTALTLLRADPGLRVALLDRQVPCSGATGAGQGYLWLAHRDVGSPLFQLAAESRAMWRELLAPAVPELTTAAVEWQEVGSMLLSSTADEAAGLAARCQALAAEGLAAQLLTAAEARRREPALQLPAQGAALLLPSDLQVNGRATAAALLRACEAHSGRFTALFEEGALRLAAGESGRVDQVQTQARRVRARRSIVVALGAWSGAFLADQLADVRWAGAFRPRRGLLLEMTAPAGMPAVSHGLMEVSYTSHYSRQAIAGGKGAQGKGDGDSEEGIDITFTATTSASGSLLVGSSREFAGYSRDAPEHIVSAIMQRAAHFLPALAAVRWQDISVRAGPRPFATAGGPTVSPVPGVEGLLVAAGHEGSGLTMAPATAELVAAYLLDQPSRLDERVVEALRCPFGLSIEDYLSM